jgi:hypothetical protein
MYRPQFAYPDPPSPCEDQPCQYSFDSTNCPTFLGALPPGGQTNRIPLPLDQDAAFYLRGISTTGAASIRIEDCNGNAVSDSENAQNSSNFADPYKYSDTLGAGFVALESGNDDVFCPAGGNLLVYLYNGTGSTIYLTTCALNLFGVKRYYGEGCAI